jgi:hypothetical protein
MLTPSQHDQFHQQGFVRIEGAFAADAAAAMTDHVWTSLTKRFGVSKTDPATWKLPLGLGLKGLRRDALFREVATPTTKAALDELVGEGSWEYPRHWGQFLVSFPNPGAKTWTVPHNWHTDWPYRASPKGPVGALLFGFLSPVPPRHGGTVALEGSPEIVRAFVAKRPQVKTEKMKVTRLALMNSDPWLKDLNFGHDDGNRVERFMEMKSAINGVPVRVTELTGDPGDIVIGHPWLLHSAAAHCGTQPRFMFLQRVKPHENSPDESTAGPRRDDPRPETR